MITFPNCKINLGLHVTGKRSDGYHNLQTVFYPVPLYEALEIITEPDSSTPSFFAVTGTPLNISAADNICARAYELLKKDFPQLPAIQLHLHKTIPTGAGLGGGSADGAATLLLINKKFRLGLTQEQLLTYALQLGSDCPFFIINKPCFAQGRGELLEEVALDLAAYQIAIVNPGIHISTATAFADIQPNANVPDLKSVVSLPVEEWKDTLTNHFENGIFNLYPEISAIKEKLYDSGATYASMTGTGSTVFGLFEKEKEISATFPAAYFFKTI